MTISFVVESLCQSFSRILYFVEFVVDLQKYPHLTYPIKEKQTFILFISIIFPNLKKKCHFLAWLIFYPGISTFRRITSSIPPKVYLAVSFPCLPFHFGSIEVNRNKIELSVWFIFEIGPYNWVFIPFKVFSYEFRKVFDSLFPKKSYLSLI